MRAACLWASKPWINRHQCFRLSRRPREQQMAQPRSPKVLMRVEQQHTVRDEAAGAFSATENISHQAYSYRFPDAGWRYPHVSLVISRLTTIWSSPGLGQVECRCQVSGSDYFSLAAYWVILYQLTTELCDGQMMRLN